MYELPQGYCESPSIFNQVLAQDLSALPAVPAGLNKGAEDTHGKLPQAEPNKT